MMEGNEREKEKKCIRRWTKTKQKQPKGKYLKKNLTTAKRKKNHESKCMSD